MSIVRRISILVLYWAPHEAVEFRPAIRHHLHALDAISHDCEIVYHNTYLQATNLLAWRDFDAIILHTTLLCLRWCELLPAKRKELNWLRETAAIKIAMPQDEYDHSEVLDEWLFELDVSVVCTNFDERFRRILYPIMHSRAKFYHTFTGYIDERTARSVAPRLRKIVERDLDLVYRASHLPYWFGSQGQLKHRIADIVNDRAQQLGLRCDISTRYADAILSDHWFDFLASSRATIGCESGSSVLNRRGEVRTQIQRWLKLSPEANFEEISQLLPPGWDDWKFFAISPRHFEAVITKTCQILVEGEYDGIFQPNRHYIPLRRDFGNLDEVLDKLRDADLLQRIADCAYEEIYRSQKFTYATLGGNLLQIISETKQPARSRLQLPVRKIRRIISSSAMTTHSLCKAVFGALSTPFAIVHRALRRLAKVAAFPRLLLKNSLIRQILYAYACEKPIRQKIGFSRLAKELVRLGQMLATAHQPDPTSECAVRASTLSCQPFGLLAHFDFQENVLLFISVPIDSWLDYRSTAASGPTELLSRTNWWRFASIVRQKELVSIVWDHSIIGKEVVGSGSILPASFFLGADGRYRFDALAELARNYPSAGIRIFEQLIDPESSWLKGRRLLPDRELESAARQENVA